MNAPYKGKFKVTQIYKGVSHKGLDLVGLDSKHIYSTANGVVEVAGYDIHYTGGMGLYIRIKEEGTNRRFYFAHLSTALVKVGDSVKDGELIGVEGNTGNSTGSHLHYEVRTGPVNTTFLDVSSISKIPNSLGVFFMPDIRDTAITVGSTVVKAKLIDGVTHAPLREMIDAIKAELEVTWDKTNGAGVTF